MPGHNIVSLLCATVGVETVLTLWYRVAVLVFPEIYNRCPRNHHWSCELVPRCVHNANFPASGAYQPCIACLNVANIHLHESLKLVAFYSRAQLSPTYPCCIHVLFCGRSRHLNNINRCQERGIARPGGRRSKSRVARCLCAVRSVPRRPGMPRLALVSSVAHMTPAQGGQRSMLRAARRRNTARSMLRKAWCTSAVETFAHTPPA